MRLGYKLATEAFDPAELIRQAVLAEEAGFDFVEMSDHYHPWLEAQGHSAFTWSVLPVIAAKTERIGLATGVTCPSVRYHPAIIAQAAATMALVSDGRFTLGVGAGERLNEHVVGLGFPGERIRHERFREALEIIRLLWRGGYQSYQGKHLQLEDARVFDLPGELPVIAVAASGPVSARIAAELGDGLFATEPDGDLVSSWRNLGGGGPAYAKMPLAWAADEDKAAQAVLEKSRFALTGWKVMAELPEPGQLRGRDREHHR